MIKAPATLLLHVALAVIVAGALVTHFFGVTGKITLAEGKEGVSVFDVESGPSDGNLPFSITLDKAATTFYTGTTTPQNFSSDITIHHPSGETERYKITMNKIAVCDNWRFYQTGMGEGVSALSISHDPWGIGVTYAGYTLLILSMILFFFQKGTAWRAWLKRLSTVAVVITCMFAPALESKAENPRAPATIQRPLAKNLGKIYVYWNDRICPLQTMARDVTVTLYGSTSYNGYTPEQVLAGWLFNYDVWKRDFDSNNREVGLSSKKKKRLDEKRNLIKWLATGEAFKIYPYHSANDRLEWLSLAGRRPSKMSLEQWKFMTEGMHSIAADISAGKNIKANERISQLIKGQRKYAGVENLPSDAKMNAERLYNSSVHILPVAIILLVCGFLLIIFPSKVPGVWRGMKLTEGLSLLYLIYILSLRAYIGGYFPVSNGFETMLVLSVIALVAVLLSPQKIRIVNPALAIVAGAALAVAVMGNARPQIGALMPVLASPLLSIHVMLVMTAYALLFLMTIIAAKTLCSKSDKVREEYTALNHVLLVPAVFLLAAGIFIGAVWANQSWGRYWGWDPKETCALVTLFVYALPLHTRSMKFLRREKYFAIYILIAIISVLLTYFGANYIFPGLHSYA